MDGSLIETFLASTAHPPTQPTASTASNTPLVRDASIHHHIFQPHPRLHASFKNSRSACPNTLACNNSHIFAAQSEKATVHVYSRERNNQEALIPFQEKISSLALTENGQLLAIGTEKGRLLLWEVYTGRIEKTTAAHIQPVTCLAADRTSCWVLSGSHDCAVHVWAVLEHVGIRRGRGYSKTAEGPRHTLTGHSGPVVAISTGHSTSHRNIAVTASRDRTVRVWQYATGTACRTFSLSSTPLCVELDPADRATFAGCEDGKVQTIDFYGSSQSAIHGQDAASPIQLPPNSTSPALTRGDPKVSSETRVDPITALTISYDATSLLTGHTSGTVNQWDIATSRFFGTRASYPTCGGITNLAFLPMTKTKYQGLPCFKGCNIVKPRWDASFASDGESGGAAMLDYGVCGHWNPYFDDFQYAFFARPLTSPPGDSHGVPSKGFEKPDEEIVHSLAFVDDLKSSAVDLLALETEQDTKREPKKHAFAFQNSDEADQDFLPLASDGTPDHNDGEVASLRAQLEHYQMATKRSEALIDNLVKAKRDLRKERELYLRREAERLREEEKWRSAVLKHGKAVPNDGERVIDTTMSDVAYGDGPSGQGGNDAAGEKD